MFQWFPGHMTKAINKIKELAIVADLFIVTLDARIPLSSYNAELDTIAPHIPRLFLFTKLDLANQDRLFELTNRFDHPHDQVLAISLKAPRVRKQIIAATKMLLAQKLLMKQKKGILKPQLRVIVIGVPNVGKSTLINLMAQKAKAKTANIPGVTRTSLWFQVAGMQFLDTPGILWPRITSVTSATKLVITNIIKNSALRNHDLFYESYRLLSKHSPDKLKKIGLEPAFDKIRMHSQLLTLCEQKNFVKKGDIFDEAKGILFFVNYLKHLRGVTYD